jgi:protein-S-isoprenylcysteine O-methyltransferase Ste14
VLHNFWSSPIFWFIVLNVVGFILGCFAGLFKNMRNNFSQLPKIVHKAYVIIFFVLPMCILPFLPQPRFDFHLWILIIGIILTVIGITVEVFAFCKIGIIPGGKAGNRVIDTGIYSLVRHPIYSGTILWSLGILLILRAKYVLIYVPIFIILSMILILAEENGLIEDFGEEYKEYKKKTKWRLFPYIF